MGQLGVLSAWGGKECSQMVNRLLEKGHTVTGYNRTRAKRIAYCQWDAVAGLAPCRRASADVTFVMVPPTLSRLRR